MQNDITVDNAGKFGFTFDIGGYTLDFVKSLQETQKKIAAQPAGDAASSAADMEMLGLMQQLSLNGAAIRFDDASLTGVTLDFVAQQQGQKREDVVNLAKASLPFMLMQMKHARPGRCDLAGHQRLSRRSEKHRDHTPRPPAPVPFTLLGGAAMANPNDPGATAKAIWNMLGVTVTANQP